MAESCPMRNPSQSRQWNPELLNLSQLSAIVEVEAVEGAEAKIGGVEEGAQPEGQLPKIQTTTLTPSKTPPRPPPQALSTLDPGPRTCPRPAAARSTGAEGTPRLSASAPWTAPGRTGSSPAKMPIKTRKIETLTSSTIQRQTQ